VAFKFFWVRINGLGVTRDCKIAIDRRNLAASIMGDSIVRRGGSNGLTGVSKFRRLTFRSQREDGYWNKSSDGPQNLGFAETLETSFSISLSFKSLKNRN